MNEKLEQLKEKLSALDQKTWYYILAGVALLIVILDFFIIMKPQIGSLSKLNTEITTFKRNINYVETEKKRIAQNREKIRDLKGKISNINQRIRPKTQIPMIIEDISKVAIQNGVKIDQIMPLTAAQELLLENEEGTYYSLPISIEARSPYHGFGHFLNDLEEVNIFFNMDKLLVTGNESDTKRHNVRLRVNTIIIDEAG